MTRDNIAAIVSAASHIHFIGVGGISMASLAKILASNGKTISGSDRNDAEKLTLEACGIRFFTGHSAENIKGADLVVYTAAVSADNSELMAAKEQNIPTINRAQLLGEIMRDYAVSVAVSGMHGKTTASAMTAFVLMECGLDPTALIGGNIPDIGGAMRIGSKKHMVLEACEYTDSFLNFYPHFAAILNVEEDHLDYFRDLDHIKDSFHRFTQNVDKDGTIVVCADNENAVEITQNCNRHVITYGIDGDADITAEILSVNSHGCHTFQIYEKGALCAQADLNIPGKYNVYNALAAYSLARLCGAEPADIAKALSSFHGAGRRFQYMGSVNGADIYDDYAHHPTEISALLSAVKSMEHRRIICIFQPHTYTRTLSLLPKFAEALAEADVAVIADIFAAREADVYGISSADLAALIPGAVNIHGDDRIAEYVKNIAEKGDIILTVGAGNVNKISKLLVDNN